MAYRRLKNQSGMTLMEVLIGNSLLIVVIFASLTVFKEIMASQSGAENYLNLVITRNRLMSQILDKRTWEPTSTAAENTAIKCLSDQDQSNAALRDCTGVTDGEINLYSLDGTVAFPFKTQSGTIGMDMNGVLCNHFVAPPASGHRTCPIGLSIALTAICDSAAPNCINPPFLIKARHTWNSLVEDASLRMSAFDFDIVSAGFVCPAQPANVALTDNPPVETSVSSVDGVTALPDVGSWAQTDPVLLPCRTVSIQFQFIQGNVSAIANNTTTVCLVDDGTGTCTHSIRYIRLADGTFTYDLQANGVTVANRPTWMALAGTEIFEFQVVNGLVKMCVSTRCLNLYELKLDAPFRLRVAPAVAPAAASPVVGAISISTQSL